MRLICLFLLFAVVAAAEPRLDDKGFVRDWLVGGAYPSYWVDSKPQGFNADCLGKFGGEAAAEPYAGVKDEAVFKADWGKLVAGVGSTNEWGWKEDKTLPVTWREFHCDKQKPVVRLDKMFLPVDDHIVSYASCYLVAPEAMQVKFRVGSDDDHKLYLNGALIGQANSSQDIIPDNFLYDAKLEPGLNRVLLKMVDRSGGYGFCVAVSGRDNKPLVGLPVLTEHPKWKLLADVPGLEGVDAWDNGFYAGFNFKGKPLFAGKRGLSLQFGAPQAGSYKLRLALKADGATAFQQNTAANIEQGQVFTWPLEIALPAGNPMLELSVLSSAGTALATLTQSLTVHDLAKLQASAAQTRIQTAAAEAELAAARAAGAANGRELETLRDQRKALYAKIEAAYATARAKLRSSPTPVNEPLKEASTERLDICLNGDQWAMAKASGDTPPPAGQAWRRCALPLICTNDYFRTWAFPLVGGADGKLKPAPGWDGYQYNDLLGEKSLWFKTEFTIEPGKETDAYAFVSENVSGRLRLYLNGALSGEYRGSVGMVNIPLHGVKAGANQLVLRIDLDDKILQGAHYGWGLRGDLHLVRTAPLEVADVEVKTSWRKARICVSTELENHGATAAKVRLEQYCVLDGAVKYRLKAEERDLAPRAKAAVENSGVWLEAEPWGIGGAHGKPTLYQLVSDLYVDGKLVDRRMDSFGFREFWVAGADFYLNGKRVLLQGDVGHMPISVKKANDIVFPLLRADGVNIVRSHDSEHYSPEFLRSCDQAGMLAYVQTYPVLHDGPVTDAMKKPGAKDLIPYEAWLKHPLHQYNLENYARWVKLLRNHPSVVIASTDNEIFTQAWDSLEQQDFNIRNDRLGAFYGNYVKSLNPELVMTRDGDEGTWGHKGKWQERPPCDTANYHYPDFDIANWAANWQTAYDFRPAVFGETLYCAYFDGNKGWIGASPDRVAGRAARIREIAAIYRRLEIPCVVYMGLYLDGFVQLDDSGKGNPWGITLAMRDAFNTKGVAPNVVPRYPWAKVEWPSLSGPGVKREAKKLTVDAMGGVMLNWFDPAAPSHVRNQVNDAFRDTLIPQPPLAPPQDAECVVELGPRGEGKLVKATALDPLGGSQAVVADAAGTAWLQLPRPGVYSVECEGRTITAELPGRSAYATTPGFKDVPRVKLNLN